MNGDQRCAVKLQSIGAQRVTALRDASAQIKRAANDAVSLEISQQTPNIALRRQWFQHHFNGAATGQTKLIGLIGGDAVANALGHFGGKFAVLHLRNQIVFNAAAGNGTDHLSVITNRHHCTHWAWCAAPRAHDSAERCPAALLRPCKGRLEYVEIEVVHQYRL